VSKRERKKPEETMRERETEKDRKNKR
jgi:hypothetical protein